MKLSIAEIITETSKMEHDADQVEWLKKHDDPMLRLILKFWYNENIEFLVPSTPPPYNPTARNNHGILYGKAKILLLFVKGGIGDNLSQRVRESRFIELLETVHEEDAKILVQMISKKPADYLSKEVISEAFPELF